MAAKGDNSGAGNSERDQKSIDIRRSKKKTKKTTGKSEQTGFIMNRKVRKNRKSAEDAMALLPENAKGRTFSIRAWDNNGDEVWLDDNVLLETFHKDWSFMQRWALAAKHGEIYQTLRSLPLRAEFFFRRVA